MTQENVNPMQEQSMLPEKKAAGKKVNYTTVINLVLFCGLIVLYALYFAGIRGKSSTAQEEQISSLAEKVKEGTANIAFISSERLMEEYELAKKMRQEFNEEQTRMENDLSRRQRGWQSEVEKFQRDIQAGSISMDRAQAKEQELMQQQQELYQLNESFSNRLMQKELEMNNELLEKITEFLTRYNEGHDYDYILGFSRGGGILYASEQFDITNDVLEKLNAEYLSTTSQP
ncbi:MAG: OmpH family outer membrane protein [Bacteroidales bacterium]|nr:OmpH family outer membrane protein [Bacteroidales bacterium]